MRKPMAERAQMELNEDYIQMPNKTDQPQADGACVYVDYERCFFCDYYRDGEGCTNPEPYPEDREPKWNDQKGEVT